MNKLKFIVYMRRCTVSGKAYIGYTKTSLRERWRVGYSSVMKAAVTKYGEAAWEHIVLSRHHTEEKALRAEAAAIRKHNTLLPNGYNVLPTGTTNPMATSVSLEKMRKSRKGQYTEAQRAYNRSKRGKGAPWLRGENNPMKRPEVKAKVVPKLRGRSCPWLKGDRHHMRNPELAAAHSTKIKGRIMVNNGDVSRCVFSEEAKALLALGWVRGLLRGQRKIV